MGTATNWASTSVPRISRTEVNPKTQKARIHATFLGLVKDAGGQIQAKVSQEIDREVPADKLEQFRRGEIIFTAPFEAPSGRYTVEAAVTDPEGNRAGMRRFTLVVPKPGEPAVSDIALVYRLDPLESPRDPGNPFEFAGGKVMPATRPDGDRGAGYGFLLRRLPRDDSEKPHVTIEFFRDGKEVSAVRG